MARKGFMDTEHSRLLKRFHTLCGAAGVNAENKQLILAQYGVSSSKDLTTYELIEVCNKLDEMASPEIKDLNKWRKRLINAISKYLKATGKDDKATNIEYIKAVACQAAGERERFNAIALDRLRSLYNAFTVRLKDLKKLEENDKTHNLQPVDQPITSSAMSFTIAEA